jgi:hypothetical protein
MKLYKKLDNKYLGKKMLHDALIIEESLANLLQTEVKMLKKKNTMDNKPEDVEKLNKLIKYIIFTLTILDDRIKTGLDLMDSDNSENFQHK